LARYAQTVSGVADRVLTKRFNYLEAGPALMIVSLSVYPRRDGASCAPMRAAKQLAAAAVADRGLDGFYRRKAASALRVG